MKLVYLFIPHLPVQVEQRRLKPALLSHGLVVGGRPWDPSIVLDCCPKAEEAGIAPGMLLARAALRCPEAHFIPADHAAYQDVQTQLDAALRQFTDRVETAGLGAFFLMVGHLARRFDGDAALIDTLIERVREAVDLDLQVGLAEERFTAEQAASAARRNHAVIVPPCRGRSFLAPLPLSVLPAEAEILRRLALLGVHTLGDLAALPRTALIRQFGAQAGFLHDLAAGADPRPVHPDAPPLELRHQMVFEPETRDRRTLLVGGKKMGAALAQTLDEQGYQAQGVRIEVLDSTDQTHATGTSVEPPTADGGRLVRRIQFLLNRLPLAHPVEALEVIIYPLRPVHLGATQLALFSASGDQRWQRLQEALRRLRARFGELIVMVASLISPPRPREIEVTFGPNGLPVMLSWGDSRDLSPNAGSRRITRIRRIYEHWRERRFWWAQPVERNYYRLEDATGAVHLIYQDLRTGSWWLERRKL